MERRQGGGMHPPRNPVSGPFRGRTVPHRIPNFDNSLIFNDITSGFSHLGLHCTAPNTNFRLANLRPQLLGKLLRECKSVKVKRLFLWYADRHGHAWFKDLDQSSIYLGKGKRQLAPQGHFDSRYQITLPIELFNAGGRNDGE